MGACSGCAAFVSRRGCRAHLEALEDRRKLLRQRLADDVGIDGLQIARDDRKKLVIREQWTLFLSRCWHIPPRQITQGKLTSRAYRYQ